MTARSSRTYPVVIPANSAAILNVTGEFIYVLECDLTSFLVAMDGGPSDETKFRTYRRLPDGDSYSRLEIENPNGADLTLKIVAGFGSYSDDEVSIGGSVMLATPTGLSTTADKSMLATATTIILAANAARKTVTISNLDGNAEILRIGDVNVGAAQGVQLLPGQSVTIETEAEVYGYNPGAAAQSVGIAEVSQ